MLEFTEKELLNLAGNQSFDKGKDYFKRGYVQSINYLNGKLIGLVEGSDEYIVKLWHNDYLNYDCSCPYANEGHFCKHLVALGLAYLNDNSTIKQQPDLKTSLEALSQEKLIEIILKEGQKNPKFLNKVSNALSKTQPKNNSILNLKTNFDKAFYIRDFIEYDDAYDYFHDLREEVLEPIEEYLPEKEVIELIYYAFDLVKEYFEAVDDSSGEGGLFIDSLSELLLKAYKIHKTNFEEIAEKLLERMLKLDYYGDNALEDYKEVLGENGLAYFYELVWEKWNALPALTKGSKSDYGSGRSTLHYLLKEQAKTAEELAFIYQKDLSHSWGYLQIAEAYYEHKQNEKALEWLQKGLSEFPENTDRLKALMAEILHSEGKYYEASKITFEQFQSEPDLNAFIKLQKYAEAAEAWDLFRQKALEFINKDRKKFANLYIEIMLWENKPEIALQEAKTHGCNYGLWLKIADKLGSNQIQEALKIYKNHIEKTVSETNNRAYEEGANYLTKVQALSSPQDFANYVAELKQKFKPKKNFIKILETKFS